MITEEQESPIFDLFVRTAIEKCSAQFPQLVETDIIKTDRGFMSSKEDEELDADYEEEEDPPYDVIHFHSVLCAKKEMEVKDAPKDFRLHRIFYTCVQYKFDIEVTSTNDFRVKLHFDHIDIEEETCLSGEQMARMIDEIMDDLDDDEGDEDPDFDFDGDAEELIEALDDKVLDHQMQLTKDRMEKN